MAGQVQDCVETLCLGQLSNLEQLEGPWMDLIATGEPTMAATALRLFLCHLEHTVSMTQRAMVISQAEQSVGLLDPATIAASS